METKEFQFKGLTLSGFAMLFLNILLTVLSAVMVVAGFVWCQHELLAGLLIGVGFALLAVTLFVWGGFVMVELLKTEDIHPPKTGISVHFSGSLV